MIFFILLAAAAVLALGFYFVAGTSGERRRKGQAGVPKTPFETPRQSRATGKL